MAAYWRGRVWKRIDIYLGINVYSDSSNIFWKTAVFSNSLEIIVLQALVLRAPTQISVHA